MTIKIGINGMGRIGRMVVRSIVESKNKNLKIIHINNRSNSETTSKLIKYKTPIAPVAAKIPSLKFSVGLIKPDM